MPDWANRFARKWLDAWNDHDLPRILSHYSTDVVFVSDKAIALTGAAELCGKAALGRYWGKALELQPDLHFRLLSVFQGPDMVVLRYLNQNNVHTVEVLQFGPDKLVLRGAACRETSVTQSR